MNNRLKEVVQERLIPKLENSLALGIFARERAKFEGWLKVELCEAFLADYVDVIPEKDGIDVTFNSSAIELKTVNTNYTYPNTSLKTKPITENVKGVIEDIEKLQKLNWYEQKVVLFVVFPLEHENSYWQNHLKKISNRLNHIEHLSFNFSNGVPGVVYIGKL